MTYRVRYGVLVRHWHTATVDAATPDDARRQLRARVEMPDGLNLNDDDADYADFVAIDRLVAIGPDGVETDLGAL